MFRQIAIAAFCACFAAVSVLGTAMLYSGRGVEDMSQRVYRNMPRSDRSLWETLFGAEDEAPEVRTWSLRGAGVNSHDAAADAPPDPLGQNRVQRSLGDGAGRRRGSNATTPAPEAPRPTRRRYKAVAAGGAAIGR